MNLRPTPTRPGRLPHEPSPGNLFLFLHLIGDQTKLSDISSFLWFIFLSFVFENICRHLFMEAVQWSKERNGWLQSGLEIKNKRTRHYFVQHSFLLRLFIIIMLITLSSKSRTFYLYNLVNYFLVESNNYIAHCPLVYSLDDYRCQNGDMPLKKETRLSNVLLYFLSILLLWAASFFKHEYRLLSWVSFIKSHLTLRNVYLSGFNVKVHSEKEAVQR